MKSDNVVVKFSRKSEKVDCYRSDNMINHSEHTVNLFCRLQSATATVTHLYVITAIVCTVLLENFWWISLYATDDAILKLYLEKNPGLNLKMI